MAWLVILFWSVVYWDRVGILQIVIKSFLIPLLEQRRYYPEYHKGKLMFNIIKSFIDFIQQMLNEDLIYVKPSAIPWGFQDD